jgi:hypothetical protein
VGKFFCRGDGYGEPKPDGDFPVAIPSHGPEVVMKAAIDDGVGVGLGPVIRVVGDVGRRLALMGHSIGREGGARSATM